MSVVANIATLREGPGEVRSLGNSGSGWRPLEPAPLDPLRKWGTLLFNHVVGTDLHQANRAAFHLLRPAPGVFLFEQTRFPATAIVVG
jgi:hypothetical protein